MLVYSLLLVSCRNTKNDQFTILISKAIELEDQGQHKEAIHFIDNAIQIDSIQSFSFVMRGKIRGLLNDDISAIEDFTRAIRLNPNNTAAFFYKGISFSSLNKEDSALNNFNRAISTKQVGSFSFDKKNVEHLNFEDQIDVPMHIIKFFRGQASYNLGQFDQALDDFRYALGREYQKGDCLFNIGLILLLKRNITDACYSFKEAKKEGNTESIYYLNKYCK